MLTLDQREGSLYNNMPVSFHGKSMLVFMRAYFTLRLFGQFIAAKCSHNMTFDLVNDFSRALEVPDLPDRAKLAEYATIVNDQAYLFSLYPDCTPAGRIKH